MTTTTIPMTYERATEVMNLAARRFGSADMTALDQGYEVHFVAWDTTAAAQPRHYKYQGTEFVVHNWSEFWALDDRRKNDELLSLEDAGRKLAEIEELANKLGLTFKRVA